MRIARTKDGEKWHLVEHIVRKGCIGTKVKTYCCGDLLAHEVIDVAACPRVMTFFAPKGSNVCARTRRILGWLINLIVARGWVDDNA